MKKIYFLIIPLTLTLLTAPIANASESSVNVSSITEGGQNNVYIDNNTSTTSESRNSVTGRTDIIINTNGKVKEYHSATGGSVSLSSDDGTSKVNINQEKSTSLTPTLTPKSEIIEDGKTLLNPSPKTEIKQEQKIATGFQVTLKQYILKFISSLKKLFSF